MIKTKIAFDEIQAGDLLEIVSVEQGIKAVMTGIAFEKFERQGEIQWETAQGGLIAANYSGEEIYRIDVKEAGFDDVQIGDLIKVTYEPIHGDMMEVTKTGIVYTNHNGAWVTPAYETLVTVGGRGKIEILERGE